MINKTVLGDRLETERHIHKHLEPRGWDRMIVGVHLMKFEDVHGSSAVEAMARYIDWAEKQDAETQKQIAVTLGHDLMHYDKLCMSPRTANY